MVVRVVEYACAMFVRVEARLMFVFTMVLWSSGGVNCLNTIEGTPLALLVVVERLCWRTGHLAAEAVEGAALALERVDDVHGGDGLAAGVLGVGHGVTDDVLEEDLEDTAGLLVDEAADALDTTTAREAADGGLGDTLDVVAKDLAVALGAALSESLTSLSTSRHVVRVLVFVFVTSEGAKPGFL